MSEGMQSFEVAVVGGGPTGLTAAVALAAGGVATVLVCKAAPADNRTTALWSGSVAALEALEVWSLARANAAALTAFRLIDETSRRIRALDGPFAAVDYGMASLSQFIANH